MFSRAPLSWGQLLAVLLVGVVIVYLLIAALSPGYVSDIGTNKVWGRHVAREGIHEIYRIPTDYPPVLLYFFGLAGEIYERFVDPSFREDPMLASQVYTFLIKLPGIVFHPVLRALHRQGADTGGLAALRQLVLPQRQTPGFNVPVQCLLVLQAAGQRGELRRRSPRWRTHHLHQPLPFGVGWVGQDELRPTAPAVAAAVDAVIGCHE